MDTFLKEHISQYFIKLNFLQNDTKYDLRNTIFTLKTVNDFKQAINDKKLCLLGSIQMHLNPCLYSLPDSGIL